MSAFLTSLNPGLFLLLAALAGFAIPAWRVRQALMVAAPVIGLVLLLNAEHGVDLQAIRAIGLALVVYRVDPTSFVFGLAFLVAALLNAIYALHRDDRLQDGMSLALAGSAVTAVFAGDLMTMFIFWELTAVAAVFLILRAGTRTAYFASMRFLALQVLSGVLFLDAIAYAYKYTGSLQLEAFESLGDYGAIYLFGAIAIKAAFPLVHNWLQDSYSKATPTGSVVCSGFLTSLAVYGAARLFPGLDILVLVGAVMAVFPVFLAMLSHDLRAILAYGLNSQLGMIICAIGLADLDTGQGRLAMNAALAQAFTLTVFVPLLFMVVGAVMIRTGTSRTHEVGGLCKTMPFTTIAGLVGAASFGALPLFSGFVSIPMILRAAAQDQHMLVWIAILFALAGSVGHTSIRLPYAMFFAPDRANRVEEAPFNMQLAMGLAAALCILVGVPSFFGLGHGWLYSLLPYQAEAMAFAPYSAGTVLAHMQVFVFAALAFIVMKRFGLMPLDKPSTLLDTDWIYRRLGYGLFSWTGAVWGKAGPALSGVAGELAGRAYERIEAAFSPRGRLSQGPLSGGMAIWTAALLGMAMLLSFITVR